MTTLGLSGSYGSFFWPTIGVMVLIALLIGGLALVRKYMFASENTENDPMAGFSLSSMRMLVKQGKMTPEEYEAARNQIVAAAQKQSEREYPVEDLAPEKKAGRDDPI